MKIAPKQRTQPELQAVALESTAQEGHEERLLRFPNKSALDSLLVQQNALFSAHR
jgi:hypothetical protein